MRFTALILSFGLALAGAFPREGRAQSAADSKSRSLPEALAAARTNPPIPDASVALAKDRLARSIDQLEKYLDGSGPAISSGWGKLLDLPGLKAELARPEPDLALLSSLRERFYQNHLGLERKAFLTVREELSSYLIARSYAAESEPQTQFHNRVQELQGCLARLDASYSEEDAHRAGELVAWLDSLSAEGAQVATAVRGQYCRLNGVGYASARVVNLLMERKVEERNFITDTMLGASTSGMAYTIGHVSFGVLPNSNKGTLEIRLNGTVNCPSTVAQRRNVTAYSSSQTALRANKQVHFGENGLSFLPAAAASTTSMQLQDISANRRFVENLAWRRASRMLPEAEQAASRKAETEASTKLDEQAAVMLAGVNDTYNQKICGPLLRTDALPSLMKFWSDATHLRVAFSQWNGAQLAPATPVPEFPADYDLACGAHESMVNNFTEVLLEGATTHDHGWAHVVELMAGSVPRPLWVHDRTERWTATFADDHPFVARFGDGRVSFTLRFKKIVLGERTYEHPIEVEARLIPQTSERDGPVLVRNEALDIRVAPGLDSQAEAELRSFLAAKVGAVFPHELYFDGFSAPAGGTIGRLRQLNNVEFRSANGWLTLGYKIISAPTETAGGGR